ncbi:hypothetical protein HPB50_019576 [Hyalomma asiaticum]|uniref:Uncharacterized protein n=1 Tax=Hyalomma asiaticum TaxID=266040 RepID=A0ACB7TKS2_HYAAI|nr:hypothetical protein HPB50_019576 [Hyalomma asiaticum]
MELNLMLAQERRRQLQLLIELEKLKQARASRAEQVGKVVECMAHSEPAAKSLAVRKAAVSASVLRTEWECAVSSEPERQIQGMLLATQVAGRSEVPCSDAVAGDNPDTAPLCSQNMEAETRTAELETELGSDPIAEANVREDAASLSLYQETSKLQESCKSFDPLGNSCSGYEETMIASSLSAGAVVKTSLVERLRGGDCGADRVPGTHSVVSWLNPVDTADAAPVAGACELPESNEEPRSELAQIGHSASKAGEAGANTFDAGTWRQGRSQAQCGENSPHTFVAHPLQSNFCWHRPAEEMEDISCVSTVTELTRGGRSILLATLSDRSICSHSSCIVAIEVSFAPGADPAGAAGVCKWAVRGCLLIFRFLVHSFDPGGE